ncbi:MAG: sugar phosphate isomerase/epimerase [Clostridia bacterium]|nr:sugar phosphate isomerase/epimerase [Clostridia bacterium]
MKKFKVGLQLYSVRDQMEKDMEGTLKAVKEMGYDYVEFAGYFGKSAEEIRALLDKYSLTCISVHQGLDFYEEGGQSAAEYIKTLGAKYSAIPWYQAEKLAGSPEWEETKAIFNRCGELLKKNGIQMLYHNHDFEFVKVDGKYKHDYLMEEISRDLLKPEFDTCWVRYAGEDPCKYLDLYAGDVEVLHLKDFTCKKLANGPAYALIDAEGNPIKGVSKEENEFRFRPVGQGMQDFPAILTAAEKAGTEYIIVEQDQTYELPSLEAVRQSREYLKTLGQ